MKKFFLLPLCLLLCLSCFAGCSDPKPGPPPEMVEISGKWEMANELTPAKPSGGFLSKSETIQESVSFFSNDRTFAAMEWSYHVNSLPGCTKSLRYGGEKIYITDTVSTPPIASTWTEDAYRIIDFGTEPQPVSKEFYDWLVANATPVES